MIQRLRDEGFESSPYPLHTGNQEMKKYEGSQNYLAGVGDNDDEIPVGGSMAFVGRVWWLGLLMVYELLDLNLWTLFLAGKVFCSDLIWCMLVFCCIGLLLMVNLWPFVLQQV
ncbi:unnamed protein product [Lathyrus oleraceus]